MTYNTIILLHGHQNFPVRDWLQPVKPGDSIWGIDNDSKEIMRWSIDQESAAREELSRRKCQCWRTGNTMWADEYALEFCECDEDGDKIEGGDFELAALEMV